MGKKVYYYKSGPIERQPQLAFHANNILDAKLKNFGFEFIGDTFSFLKDKGIPQEVYGPSMKRLRNQGFFKKYLEEETLLRPSLESVRKVDFVILKPGGRASGGTTSETVTAHFFGVPKLTIVGPHGENIVDNDSTFMIRMLTDGPSLIFEKEIDLMRFIEKNLGTFKDGKEAIKNLILELKKENPHINDLPRELYDNALEGKTIILLGRPGCGKGTQAKMLQKLAGFKYFGSGRELRRLGARLKTLSDSLAAGNLAPEIIIKFLISDYILRLERFESVVLDGTPRKIGEAEALVELLDVLGRKPSVFVLEIDDSLARERIMNRKNCDSCEVSFTSADQKFTRCPECDTPLKIRPENADSKAVQKILSWYKTEVEPVIGFFDALGLVTRIPADQGREEIFGQILGNLKSSTTITNS